MIMLINLIKKLLQYQLQLGSCLPVCRITFVDELTKWYIVGFSLFFVSPKGSSKSNSPVPSSLDQGHSQQLLLQPCRRLDHTLGNNPVLGISKDILVEMWFGKFWIRVWVELWEAIIHSVPKPAANMVWLDFDKTVTVKQSMASKTSEEQKNKTIDLRNLLAASLACSSPLRLSRNGIDANSGRLANADPDHLNMKSMPTEQWRRYSTWW